MKMKEKIEKLKVEFQNSLKKITSLKDLEILKNRFFAKKGVIVSFYQDLKTIPNEQKAAFGKKINELRETLETLLTEKQQQLTYKQLQSQVEKEWIDISLDLKKDSGALHPISKIQYELEDIFTAMGFSVLDGPHIETNFYNFEALNIPKNHPSRDLQDTYYFDENYLLRTQTSPIQIRGMELFAKAGKKPPIRIIGPGKVFRAETRDASHENCFHQLEGIVVDKNITVRNLIYFMEVMLAEIFYNPVKVRLRPGYFPFVEPGFELDMSCQICSGDGCKMCKKTGWVEMIGCGMVHPKVLEVGKIDPKIYSGFAFGLGIDRLCIMKHKINDIRYFHSGDLKFYRQFV